jgi:hypothetical protein
MARTAFGRPLRGVAFDVAISVGVAMFALAAVKTQQGSWRGTLIGLAMAVAVLFRRPRPVASRSSLIPAGRHSKRCGGWSGPSRRDAGRFPAGGEVAHSGAVLGGIGAVGERRRPAVRELGALLDRSRAAGLVVRDDVRGDPADLPTGVDLTIYRVVQESLTNALKHAGTGPPSISPWTTRRLARSG